MAEWRGVPNRECAGDHTGHGDDIAWCEAIADEVEQREHAEEWADKLALAIASREVIGEHSADNNPWQNALAYAQARRGGV